MNSKDQEKLLRALLPGEEEADLRGTSLASGLKAVRRRRKNRTFRLYAMACLPLIAAAILYLDSGAFRGRQNPMSNLRPQTVASGSSRVAAQPIKVISDEELFALFPGRSLALIGSPGHQKLVFLDR
jgi:hypothetical protein